MELIVNEISAQDMDECLNLFINVFNSKPWNDQWTFSKAKELFEDFSKTPGFIGFAGRLDNTIISVCIGHVKKWWNSSEFHIEEYYVSREWQHKGMGTSFLKDIEVLLFKRGIKKITLLTARNTPAEKFYRKNSFRNLDYMTIMKKDI